MTTITEEAANGSDNEDYGGNTDIFHARKVRAL